MAHGLAETLLAAVLLVSCAKAQEPALLPLPKQVEFTGGSIRAGAPETLSFVEAIPEAVLNENEAYRLTVDKAGVHIEAVTERGVWNARQTLRQLRDSHVGRRPSQNDKGKGRIPCCRIVDWPSFRVRGWMMDVGRTYVSLEELKREVDIFSQFKVNVFHLHLTENEAWRLESRRYPQLNAPENMNRQPGKFYTQDEMRELDAFCRERGVTLIPELDIPGHSGAFERAMGFGMQTPEGKAVLRELLEEVFDTFSGPYVHIGTDEVAFTDSWLISEMVAYIRAHGRKALSWNPGWPYRLGEIDGLQLWSYRGEAKEGIPAVDSRLHYINHFDLFGDLIGLHTSTIYGQTEGSDDIVGSIIALWNDRYLTSEENILKENNLYASVLALADRAWRGGGYQYFDGFGTVLPDEGPAREDFLDFERRLGNRPRGDRFRPLFPARLGTGDRRRLLPGSAARPYRLCADESMVVTAPDRRPALRNPGLQPFRAGPDAPAGRLGLPAQPSLAERDGDPSARMGGQHRAGGQPGALRQRQLRGARTASGSFGQGLERTPHQIARRRVLHARDPSREVDVHLRLDNPRRPCGCRGQV